MSNTYKIQARFLREDDWIPGLDNAYVVEVRRGADYEIPGSGTYPNPRVSAGDVVYVTYHDAEGEENYMLLQPTAMLTIQCADDPSERTEEEENEDEY